MYKRFIFSGIMFFSFYGIASAQMVNKDSLSLVNKIASDKEKLMKLRNSIPEKEKAKKETAMQAQESADDNRKAANKLSDDPQDRKLARRADSKAGDARTDARRARSAAQDLDDLNKEIERLQERIDKEQKKLDKLMVNMPMPAAPMPGVKTDTSDTQH